MITIGNCIELSEGNHIVFLTPGFPRDEEDSLCIPAMQLFLKGLKERYSGKISVISFQYPYQSKEYQWNGIDVYALGGKNRKLKKHSVWNKSKKVFNAIHRNNRVTRIHSFWLGECAYIGGQLSEKFNIPHCCTLMGQDALSGNKFFDKIKKLPPLITLSEFHKNTLLENYNLNSSVIPWGVNVNEAKIEKVADIVGVGALTDLKRFDEFVQVIAKVQEQIGVKLRCRIIGDGPNRNALKDQITEYNLDSVIELLGELNHLDTQGEISKSKILLHMSEYESFGMVVAEGLVNGCLVVAKPVGIGAEMNAVEKIRTVGEAVEKVVCGLLHQSNSDNLNLTVEHTVDKYLQLFGE